MTRNFQHTRFQAVACGLLITVASCSPQGDKKDARTAAEIPSQIPVTVGVSASPQHLAAVRAFVQQFYTWYAPIANGKHHGPAFYAVLDQQPRVLSDALLRLLTMDRQRQAEAGNEIAGLDFDPFLDSQDPCEKYVVGDSVVIGESYRVSVYGICENEKSREPALVTEVARRDTSWVFVDFLYPRSQGAHLLGILGSKTP
jgi:hypothetical protein